MERLRGKRKFRARGEWAVEGIDPFTRARADFAELLRLFLHEKITVMCVLQKGSRGEGRIGRDAREGDDALIRNCTYHVP